MASNKGSSAVVETARERLAGLKACRTKPNLGADLSAETYEADIALLVGKVAARNDAKASLEQMQNEIDHLVAGLADKSSRILAGVGAQLGKDSDEYELVGGTRTSERKRPGPKKPGGAGGTPPANP
jgi:hypothetical protein